jgi:thioredoxin-like negative regulator of GroEL
MRRWKLVLSLAAIAGVLLFGGWRLLRMRRYRTALAEIREKIQTGRHGVAARQLTELLTWEPGSDEAAYLLGLCEKVRGRSEAAAAAWARVQPTSLFAVPATLARAVLESDRGRLADAERVLNQALLDPRIDGLDLRRLCASLYWHEGRLEESRRLVEANWDTLDRAGRGRTEQAIALVRFRVALSMGTSSADAVRTFLERTARLAPADDRVWLGRANLAIRQGEFDEAARWLDACLKRRPDDIPVWRARLDWAVATDRVAEAREALKHLPVMGSSPAEVHRLAAWFAARRGDAASERRALEQLIAADPGDGAALDRLAELAVAEGRLDRAAELRSQKTTLDSTKSEYKDIFMRDQSVRDAAAMGRLAERLGRFFEARAFLSLAVATKPNRDDLRAALARLDHRSTAVGEPGQTLADLLAPELDAWVMPRPRPTPLPAPSDSGAPIQFQDDALRAGLVLAFENGASSLHHLPEYMSGGIGLIDFDGDGWLDVYAVQGGPFPPRSGRAGGGDRLFRNRRDGTFEDVTGSSGLAGLPQGYGHGVVVGDYDNDGRPDLFITRWRSYALYHNRGDGTFEDATAPAGLGGDRDWPTSAAFADLDNDGDLDLYVCHYLKWDAEHPRSCLNPERSTPVSCDPRGFEALPDHVFRNDCGRFTDVTAQAGIVDRDGRGLGVVAVDVDDDNRMDLFVANDLSGNYLFRNRGGFRFDEQGLTSGVACNASGGNQAGMGVAAGDLDGDGRLDLSVTNFFNESTTLFHNLGDGQFADHTSVIGLTVPSRDRLGFGMGFLDVNNDGRLDLLTANGHLNDYRPAVPYGMAAQLLLGSPGGRLNDVTTRAGPPLIVPHIGRGLAIGDLDNDGRVDAVLVAQNEPLIYLHNRTVGGHWVTIGLEGSPSNRDGVGARVVVEAGGSRRVSQRLGGGSYLSASDGRVHIGLGELTRIDRVEVRWSSGRVDSFQNLDADRGYRLREGDPRPAGLPIHKWSHP